MLAVTQPSWGKWQTIFFTSGVESAASYCNDVIESLDKTRELYEEIIGKAAGNQELYEAAVRLHDLCEEKQGRYAPDIFLGTKVFMRGRGEPGRTPFNYPDYRHRFNKIEDLSGYLKYKSNHHLECHTLLDKLNQGFPEDEEALKAEQLKHFNCKMKWDDRAKCALENPNAFLLPPAKKAPLQMMNIRSLHEWGRWGQETEATVVDTFGPDRTHPAFKNVFADTAQEETMVDTQVDTAGSGRHTTLVAGIIAGQPNRAKDHLGAAPLAKLRIVESCRNHCSPESEIVNFSVSYRNGFWDRLQDEEYLQYCKKNSQSSGSMEFDWISDLPEGNFRDELFRDLFLRLQLELRSEYLTIANDKLLIRANGNDGVDISLNPTLISEESYCLDDSFIMDLCCIRVVHLMQNGLYPAPQATLPGMRLAEKTVCAIGVDVMAPENGGGYVPCSGSSFATPFVTSVALLLRGAFPSLAKEDIEWCILEGATPIVLDPITFEPHLIEDRSELQNYSDSWVKACRLIYGRGLLNGEGAFAMARKLMA